MGFSDKGISELIGCDADEVYNLRKSLGIIPVYKMVDTCAGEFEAVSPYYYSTYDETTESFPSDKKKVIVIGSGPIRIGQGSNLTIAVFILFFLLKKQVSKQLL